MKRKKFNSDEKQRKLNISNTYLPKIQLDLKQENS